MASATRCAENWCISAVMDRWRRRWRSRRPAARAGARRAGVTALALLAVTAALAVLLALSFHLAWPPVLVSIVGTVPALYLAWPAVPGAISPLGSATEKPAHRRLAGRRYWADWLTCWKVPATCSSRLCGPSTGPPILPGRAPGPDPPIRPEWLSGCWPGYPNSPVATSPGSILAAAASSTSGPGSPPPT